MPDTGEVPVLPLRDLISRTLQPWRRVRGRIAAGRVPVGERTTGWIDVVVPGRDVAPYIDACLRSVLSQGHWRVNVIVVDDGSADGTAERVEAWARRDSRVRLIRTDVGDPNASRNLAIRTARAEFLAFLDADDVLLAGAYRDLLASLHESGSDFAVGSYDRLERGRRTPAAFWIGEAHQSDRRAIRLVDHPMIMVNVVQWARLYRRAFWDRAGLAFPEGGHFQDQLVSARAYARAAAFDVLTRPVVSWRIRDDRSSMTQQVIRPSQVADRFRTAAEAIGVLEREVGPEIADERRVQVLSNDAAIAAEGLPAMGEEAVAALRRGLKEIAPPSDDPVWARVPAQAKVLFDLLLRGDVRRAREFIRRGGLRLVAHPVRIEDGSLLVELPFFDDGDAAVPRHRFRAAPRDVRALRDAGVVAP